MATLSGNKVKDTYESLLKLESNGVTTTLKTVEDGAGVDSALKLATNKVEVAALSFSAAPATDASELTAVLLDSNNNIVIRELDSSAFSAPSAGVSRLVDLTDTSISSVASGDLLSYNGTNWVNDSTPRTVAFVDNTNAVNFATPNANGNILFEAGNNMSITYSGNTVSFAASGGSTQTYANPMFILRPQSIYSLTGTLVSPTIAGVNNNNNTSSYLINDPSNNHFQTSAVTQNAMTVVSEGLINIDVSFYFEVSTINTTVEIALYEKPSGGSETLVQSISRDKVNTGISVVGFGLVRHVAADTDVYFKLRVTAGSAALLTSSTFSVTKLD